MSRVRVKICGITREADAQAAIASGADAIGFVFDVSSARAISPEHAAAIAVRVPSFVTLVGVFVNTPVDRVKNVMRTARLDVAQLHGDEQVEPYLDAGVRILRAVPVATDDDVMVATAIGAAATVLVDATSREARGGTGRVADWTRAAALARRRPVVLAGGLRAENIREAVDTVAPWGVDVSSGVESAPGVKDHGKIRAFFDALAKGRA